MQCHYVWFHKENILQDIGRQCHYIYSSTWRMFCRITSGIYVRGECYVGYYTGTSFGFDNLEHPAHFVTVQMLLLKWNTNWKKISQGFYKRVENSHSSKQMFGPSCDILNVTFGCSIQVAHTEDCARADDLSYLGRDRELSCRRQDRCQ